MFSLLNIVFEKVLVLVLLSEVVWSSRGRGRESKEWK